MYATRPHHVFLNFAKGPVVLVVLGDDSMLDNEIAHDPWLKAKQAPQHRNQTNWTTMK